MEQEKKALSPTEIERYRQQMMQLYQQHTPPPSIQVSLPGPSPIESEHWLEENYPEPDFERDRQVLVIENETASPPIQESAPPPPSDFVGYLRVFVFTGNEAEPIPAARVTVTRTDEIGSTVFASVQTNQDGLTPVVSLPSVDPALTLRPSTIQPYVAYDIQVSKEGFGTSSYGRVPVYGNNYVTQPVPLYPIVIGNEAMNDRRFISSGPSNL